MSLWGFTRDLDSAGLRQFAIEGLIICLVGLSLFCFHLEFYWLVVILL
jgi:hypothetical protein